MSPDKYSEVELLHDTVVLFLIFLGTSISFSIMVAPVYISNNSTQEFPFSISLPTLVISCVFDNSHSNKWYPIVLIFISLTINGVGHLFMYLLAICMSSLEKKKSLSRSSAHFLIGLFGFCYWVVWVFYIFWRVAPYQIHDLWLFSFIQ